METAAMRLQSQANACLGVKTKQGKPISKMKIKVRSTQVLFYPEKNPRKMKCTHLRNM